MSDLIGANQADAMLRRVSPEGRARALRERQRRQRRTARLAGRVVLVALAAIGALALADWIVGALDSAVVGTVALLFLVVSVIVVLTSRERPIAAATLPETPLHQLPAATATWLESQGRALPAPALSLIDEITGRLHDMTPQLARLDAREPAADAVRRLLAVEVPALVERHQSVPPRLRDTSRDGGDSADAHLVNGLRIVDEEIARMTAQLARGDVDALATQDRFLELKYQGDEILKA